MPADTPTALQQASQLRRLLDLFTDVTPAPVHSSGNIPAEAERAWAARSKARDFAGVASSVVKRLVQLASELRRQGIMAHLEQTRPQTPAGQLAHALLLLANRAEPVQRRRVGLRVQDNEFTPALAADADLGNRVAAWLKLHPAEFSLVREALGALCFPTTKKTKRGTTKGATPDLILGGLLAHHEYVDSSCGKWKAVGVRELARNLGDENRLRDSVSRFFQEKFEGHDRYVVMCNNGTILEKLKYLNGDISPNDLYGRNPPGEGRTNDD